MSLYTNSQNLYEQTIATDGVSVDYVDPTEGPKIIPDITNQPNGFLQVNPTATNIQWTSFSGGSGIPISQVNLGDGTQAQPSLCFQNDIDTGLYRPNANHLRVVANNEILADFNTTHFRSRKPLHSENGSVTAPTYSFEADDDTGIYRKGANNIAITTGGVEKVDINTISTELRGVPQTTPAQLIQPFTQSSSQSISTTSRPLTSIAQNDTTGTYIICNNASVTARIFRSIDNGDNWTALGTGTGLTIQCQDVVYGNGIWVVTQFASAVNNIRYSTDDGLNWLTPTTVNRSNRNVKFINGQFMTLHNGAIRTTTDGITWVDPVNLTGGGQLNDVAYSPTLQRYVFVSSSNNVVIINSNTISPTPTFTNVAVSFNANRIAYSPKLEMFVCQQDILPFNFQVSYDGTNWISIDPPTARNSFDIIWVNDFGGFFLAGSSSFEEVDWSYDGFTWFNATLTDNMRLRSLHYNSTTKILLACNISNTGGIPLFYSKSTLTQNPFFDGSFVNDITGQLVINNTTRITPQTLTTGRYSVNSFNKSTIECNTTSGNIDIELNGTNFSGKVGTTFKVRKTISSANAVRLVGSAITTRVLSPLGEVALFDNGSTAIDLIPATFFGSFDLVRVSDTSGGTWYVNHMIYDANGVERKLDDLAVVGDVSCVDLTATGDVSCVDITATGDVSCVDLTATGDVSCVDLTATGDLSCVDLTATGDVSCVDITATGDLSCVDLTATGDVSCVDLTATGDLSLSGAITTDLDVGKSGSGNAKNLEVFGTTLLRGNTDVGATGSGNSANLKVWGDLEYTGTLTGSVPVPTNIGNPCFSSIELGASLDVIDADINIPHFVGAYCGKTLPASPLRQNMVTLKNLGASGVGKTFYWFRSTGDVVNACVFKNESGQDAYQFWWNDLTNREEFLTIGNTITSGTHPAGVNYSFSWWKFTYMEINFAYRWIVKEIGSSWE
jgi:hypothetical protein